MANILIVILVVVVWYIYTHSKIKFTAKLWLVYGKKGSGKSTFLAKVARTMMKQGRLVWSSHPIKGAYSLSTDNYYNYRYPPGAVILLDEIGMIHDNRNFKSFSNQARDWYKLQRHANVMVVACSQTADVDVKIRYLADKVTILRGIGFLSVNTNYDRRIAVASATDNNGKVKGSSEIVDDVRPKGLLSRWEFIAGWRYWQFFDSWALPDWPESDPFIPYVSKRQMKKKRKEEKKWYSVYSGKKRFSTPLRRFGRTSRVFARALVLGHVASLRQRLTRLRIGKHSVYE